MASKKYTWEIDEEEFSLYELSSGIIKILEGEQLSVQKENLHSGACIISATNITTKENRVLRGISGLQISISIYLEVKENSLSCYFENRAWADKACGFAFSTIIPPLFITSCYGGAKQISIQNKIIDYINEVLEEEVSLYTMNIRQRILLATPLISLIIFLTMGFVAHMWTWGCLAFLLIPIMPIVLGEINYELIYPLVICCLYAGLGFGFNLWHPAWILFLTIPVYYILFPVKNKRLTQKKYSY